MRQLIPIPLALTAVLLTAPATTHATTPQRQIALLKRANATLTAQLKAARKQSATRLVRAQTAEANTTNLTAQAAALTAQVVTLTTERDNALAGLPAAISAVPLSSFAELVFAPAKAAAQRAGCGDSYYSSDGYVSYTFNLGKFCN